MPDRHPTLPAGEPGRIPWATDGMPRSGRTGGPGRAGADPPEPPERRWGIGPETGKQGSPAGDRGRRPPGAARARRAV